MKNTFIAKSTNLGIFVLGTFWVLPNLGPLDLELLENIFYYLHLYANDLYSVGAMLDL